MNTEKELLLALLIEKYGTKSFTQANSTTAQKQRPVNRRKRRHLHANHKWSAKEVTNIMALYDMGYTYAEVAREMHLMYPGVTYRTNSIKQKIYKEKQARLVSQDQSVLFND